MKKNILLLLFLLLHSQILLGQFTVKGIVSAKNNENVSFIPVAVLLARDSSLVKGVLTNENGAFVISDLDTGIYKVSIQYIGFKNKNSKPFALKHNTPSVDLGKLTLEEDITTLSQVTVTGRKPLMEYQSDRIILNVENSIITKGNKVQDLLDYTPLVNVDNQKKITVTNNESVLILVDGRQVGDMVLKSFIQNFSAEDILKIEVITNPSAIYDASFKSVINIITKKSLEDGMNGHISLNYSLGEKGSFTPDVSLNYHKGRWSIFGGASYDLSDYLFDQRLNRFFPDAFVVNNIQTLSRYNDLSTFFGINFIPNEKHSFGINLYGNWNKTNESVSTGTSFFEPTALLDSLFESKNLINEKSYSNDFNFNYIAKIDSSGKELVLNLTQTLYDKHEVQNLNFQKIGLDGKFLDEPSLLRIINPSHQNSFIAQADFFLPMSKGKLEFGGKYILVSNKNILRQENFVNDNYQFAPDVSVDDTYKESTYAAFTNYSRSLKRNWSLSAGLRTEHTEQVLKKTGFSKDYFGLFPSAGINKEFAKGHSWGFSYSRKIDRPDLSSLVPYRNIVDPFTFGEGNPYLNPQYSNSFDTYFSLGRISVFANYSIYRDMISPILYGNDKTMVYTQIMGNLDKVQEAYIGASWTDDLLEWWQTNTTLRLSGTTVKSEIPTVAAINTTGLGINFRSINIFVLPHKWKLELMINYNSSNRRSIWETKSIFWVSSSIAKEVSERINFRLQFQDIFRSQKYIVLSRYGVIDLYSLNYNDNQRIRLSISYNLGKKSVKAAHQRSIGNEDVKNRMGN